MPCGFAPIDLLFFSCHRSFALPPLLQHFLQHYVTQPLLISIAIAGAVLNLIRQQCVGSQRGYSFRTCWEERGGGQGGCKSSEAEKELIITTECQAHKTQSHWSALPCSAPDLLRACMQCVHEWGWVEALTFLDRCLKLVTGLNVLCGGVILAYLSVDSLYAEVIKYLHT